MRVNPHELTVEKSSRAAKSARLEASRRYERVLKRLLSTRIERAAAGNRKSKPSSQIKNKRDSLLELCICLEAVSR